MNVMEKFLLNVMLCGEFFRDEHGVMFEALELGYIDGSGLTDSGRGIISERIIDYLSELSRQTDALDRVIYELDNIVGTRNDRSSLLDGLLGEAISTRRSLYRRYTKIKSAWENV